MARSPKTEPTDHDKALTVIEHEMRVWRERLAGLHDSPYAMTDHVRCAEILGQLESGHAALVAMKAREQTS